MDKKDLQDCLICRTKTPHTNLLESQVVCLVCGNISSPEHADTFEQCEQCRQFIRAKPKTEVHFCDPILIEQFTYSFDVALEKSDDFQLLVQKLDELGIRHGVGNRGRSYFVRAGDAFQEFLSQNYPGLKFSDRVAIRRAY